MFAQFYDLPVTDHSDLPYFTNYPWYAVVFFNTYTDRLRPTQRMFTRQQFSFIFS